MEVLNALADALILLVTTHHIFFLIGGVLLGLSNLAVLPGLARVSKRG